jgi:hypothetical protein
MTDIRGPGEGMHKDGRINIDLLLGASCMSSSRMGGDSYPKGKLHSLRALARSRGKYLYTEVESL